MVYTQSIYIILFAVMPLVGIAKFNTDPLENVLAKFGRVVNGATIPAPRQCKRPQTSSDCKCQQCWWRNVVMAHDQLPSQK